MKYFLYDKTIKKDQTYVFPQKKKKIKRMYTFFFSHRSLIELLLNLTYNLPLLLKSRKRTLTYMFIYFFYCV